MSGTAVTRRVGLGLSAVSGLLYFLAFPGVDLWAVGFVALAPLIIALEGQSLRRATLFGWVAGLFMTVPGFYWLLEMLETFSGFPWPLCVLFLLLLCGYQAGRIAVFGALHARLRQQGLPLWGAASLGFVASELAYPLLFPWSFGAVVHSLTALTQIAELGGPIAVGLTVLAVNLLVVELVLARRGSRPVNVRMALACAAVPLLSATYGALRIRSLDATLASAPKATVGLVQANMSLFGSREEVAEGLRRHLDLTRSLRAQGPLDLVVWSETSALEPIFETDLERVIPRILGRALDVPALFGGVMVRPVNDERRYVMFNSALLTNERGRVVGRYDKHYRLPFGEFLPFGDWFPILYRWSPNSGRFAEGTRLEPLRVGNHEIATFICYEDVLPSFVRSIVRSGSPDLLANLTNDGWFGDTTEPWIHLSLAKFRAIEQRRYLVRSTNSGVSAIVDPLGRVVVRTRPFESVATRGEIAWLRTNTGYNVWGDAPLWVIAALGVGLALVPGGARRFRRRHHESNAS